MTPTKNFPRSVSLLLAFAFALTAMGQTPKPSGPQASSNDKGRGSDILNVIKSDIKKTYYDETFHGMDLEARFKAANEKIKTAASNGQIFGTIAQLLAELEDSHTFFFPPGRSADVDYGWTMQIVGDKCFVTGIKPKSDAEAKGLKEGDEVLIVNNLIPTKENFWTMGYLFNILRPQPALQLHLRRVNGKEEDMVVMAKITQHPRQADYDIYEVIREIESSAHYARHRFYELGDDVTIWKMPEFDLTDAQVDEMMGKVLKRKALILDLRGNPGGAVTTLERLAGYFFDHDVKIADLKGRKEMKPMMAKTRGENRTFKGKVIVLVDSDSASCAEVLPRLLQIEKRAVILGDRSEGAVMQAEQFGHHHGAEVMVFWGLSVTNADVIMSDGKSLEKIGVTPDELILPTAQDLANKRDPVMARAAEMVGLKMDAAKAGSLFPVEWRK